VVFLSLGVSDTRQQNKQEKSEYFPPFFLYMYKIREVALDKKMRRLASDWSLELLLGGEPQKSTTWVTFRPYRNGVSDV
jgi:hypothetical protein